MKHTYSFIKTTRQPAIDIVTNKIVQQGSGVFRCKQTGQLIEKSFIPANFVPNDITLEHKYSY